MYGQIWFVIYLVKEYLSLSHNTDQQFFFSGGFAFVYEAQDLGSGREYALKFPDRDYCPMKRKRTEPSFRKYVS